MTAVNRRMTSMASLHTNPLFARLESAERVLVAGAGGGFDVYAGLPLALSLIHQGKHVHLANLSFSALEGLPLDARLAPDVAAITPKRPSTRRTSPSGRSLSGSACTATRARSTPSPGWAYSRCAPPTGR
ncbi:hypothetical protein GCM10010433_34350 [Streptomyces pulveraceus]